MRVLRIGKTQWERLEFRVIVVHVAGEPPDDLVVTQQVDDRTRDSSATILLRYYGHGVRRVVGHEDERSEDEVGGQFLTQSRDQVRIAEDRGWILPRLIQTVDVHLPVELELDPRVGIKVTTCPDPGVTLELELLTTDEIRYRKHNAVNFRDFGGM